ncbi:acyl transferase/acyl hydrolase/lysophospholipase [Paraphysoderma sedebokerense]|nr:acyl transferase/acyl hydrolase/lysophospholipase [Paraphysoderma sedebokerense]
MGKDLFSKYKIAKETIEEADEVLKVKLSQLMMNGPQDELTLTFNAQPAIVTISIALLRVLEKEYGFDLKRQVSYALGHSLGEYSALIATKSLDFGHALKLVRLRGQAMQSVVSTLKAPTAMAALMLRPRHADYHDVERVLEMVRKDLKEGDVVELANVNSSFQAVISGTSNAVDIACRTLQAERVAARAVDLPVSAPFHCSLMQPAADIMGTALENVKFHKPIIPVIANVDAKPYSSASQIPKMLCKQVTHPVRWHSSIELCRKEGIKDFIAMGPNKVIGNLLKKDFPTDRVLMVCDGRDFKSFTHK